MSAKRRKIQLELSFVGKGRSEAPKLPSRVEAHMAVNSSESPASTVSIMEEVLNGENLRKAYKRVKANKGSPGVDGMSVDELKEYLKENLPKIRKSLLEGEYKVQPVKRVRIPKPNGGTRNLGIPTVMDRFVQQAIAQVLQKYFEPTFSEYSYGFRPGRSAHQAIKQAQEYIEAGHEYVVDMDIEKFFDGVNHDRLMSKLAKRIEDKRLLKVIRKFLQSGVMDGGLVSQTTKGAPQGGSLSPLLSNIVLDELDKELEKRGHKFVRYADDCNIYVKSERAGHRVMSSVSRYIERKLKLKLNRTKSAVATVWERDYLGFGFLKGRKKKTLRKVSEKSVKRFKKRIRELTRRTKLNMRQIVKKIAEYVIGWIGYYGYCETPSTLRDLEAWIRRRLRCLIWKQWKQGNIYRRLRREGIGVGQAWNLASGRHGQWRASRSIAMSKIFPNDLFREMGLPEMKTRKNA